MIDLHKLDKFRLKDREREFYFEKQESATHLGKGYNDE